MNTEEKPQITVNLSPVLEAYCRWIFETNGNEKEIMISRRHDVGKHIFSHVLPSDHAVKRPKKTNLVTFTLPTSDNSWLALKTHFLYIDDWGEMKINDFIQSDFDFWARERFSRGYNFGWCQKDIIDAILRGLNLRNNAANYDAIKKNDYRNRRSKQEKRFEMLLTADIQ
jgi:hypothetical protein